MLGRILVPVDGSELSARILPRIRGLVASGGAEVVLLRVIPDRAREQDAEAARHGLEELARSPEAGARARTRVVVGGDPAARILEIANELEPSMIAMSTHGATGLRRFTRGSVAERVLRGSRFPLLTASPFALGAGSEAPGPGFGRILVPLDGSDEAAAILPLVGDVARPTGAEVVLVHALEPAASFEPGAAGAAKYAREDRLEVQAMLEHHRKALGDVRSRVRILDGPPAPAILDAAEDEKADLIALTTHGRSGASRWIYGSVAEHVIRHAPRPLVVLRVSEGAF